MTASERTAEMHRIDIARLQGDVTYLLSIAHGLTSRVIELEGRRAGVVPELSARVSQLEWRRVPAPQEAMNS